MTIEYRQKALEALAHYNITATEIELLRHNENLTYRVGNEYLLQIHEPTEGFSAEFFYDGVDRVEIYKSELDFQTYLKKQSMQIREAVENRYGELITKLQNGTYVTVSKWLDGESLDKLELNDAICYQIGDMLARLHQKAKGFRVSPVKTYGKQHCECTKRRFQALENLGLSNEYSLIMQEWFAPRMQRWNKENLIPYVQGERIYADDFYLLHVQG